MKRILFILLVISNISVSAPADESTGVDLINAAKLANNAPDKTNDPESTIKAIYLIGYIEGFTSMDAWYQGVQDGGDSMIKLPKEYTLIDVLDDISGFIGDSKVLRAVPAKKFFDAYITTKYGTSKKIRALGGKMLISLVGEKGHQMIEEIIKNKKPLGEDD
jgi:hypothetical protein